MNQIFLYFLILMLGASFGSFFSVLLTREKFFGKDGILKGESACPKCNYKLKWFNLFPIFSYLFQKGKCYKCGLPIPRYYLYLEFFYGFIFFTSYYLYVNLNHFFGQNPQMFLVSQFLLFILSVIGYIYFFIITNLKKN